MGDHAAVAGIGAILRDAILAEEASRRKELPSGSRLV